MANSCVKALPPCELRTPKYAPLVREGFSLLFIQISPSGNEKGDAIRLEKVFSAYRPRARKGVLLPSAHRGSFAHLIRMPASGLGGLIYQISPSGNEKGRRMPASGLGGLICQISSSDSEQLDRASPSITRTYSKRA